MQFNELIKEVKTVVFEELRKDEDNYFEAVVVKGELARLTPIIEKFLGSPIPSSQLPPQLKNTLKQVGGIRRGQVLYCKTEGDDAIITMLWPWQDGERTTIKIIKKE